jgi:hypothetical protein
MSDSDFSAPRAGFFTARFGYWLAFAFVIVGLFNAMPGIPGLDEWFAQFTGQTAVRIRRFPYEYFYPLAFCVMMLIVALRQVRCQGVAPTV